MSGDQASATEQRTFDEVGSRMRGVAVSGDQTIVMDGRGVAEVVKENERDLNESLVRQ